MSRRLLSLAFAGIIAGCAANAMSVMPHSSAAASATRSAPGTMVRGTLTAHAVLACGPGAVCAQASFGKFKLCTYTNKVGPAIGGSPLIIVPTENATGAVYLYWINPTNKTVSIKTNVSGDYACVA